MLLLKPLGYLLAASRGCTASCSLLLPFIPPCLCCRPLCLPPPTSQAVQDDAARTAGFSLLLRRLFEECDEPGLVEVAAQALGHLVAHSGQSMSDIVERQVGPVGVCSAVKQSIFNHGSSFSCWSMRVYTMDSP